MDFFFTTIVLNKRNKHGSSLFPQTHGDAELVHGRCPGPPVMEKTKLDTVPTKLSNKPVAKGASADPPPPAPHGAHDVSVAVFFFWFLQTGVTR